MGWSNVVQKLWQSLEFQWENSNLTQAYLPQGCDAGFSTKRQQMERSPPITKHFSDWQVLCSSSDAGHVIPATPKQPAVSEQPCCRGHGSSLARRGKAQRRGEGSIMSLCHLEWKTDFWVGSVPFTSIFPKVVLLSREITYLYISWFESVKIHLHRAGCRVSQTLESEKSFVIPYFWTPNFIRKNIAKPCSSSFAKSNASTMLDT